jgi:DNA-binding MarR family transcriptional regulator
MMARADTKTIGTLGRQISDATILMHEAIARKAGLTGTDHKYLNIIVDKGTITAGELANLTGLTTGAVTGVIDRFEKKKLVKREFDKTDRRKILIVPNTAKVRKLFANSHLDLGAQIANLLAKFTDEEVDAIARYLNATVDIMNNITNRLNKR